MKEKVQSQSKLFWPTVWLILGLAGAILTVLAAAWGTSDAVGILGGLTSAFAIILTFVIAHRQAQEALILTETVMKIDSAVSEVSEVSEKAYHATLEIAERDSAQSYQGVDEDIEEDNATDAATEPVYADEALQRLRALGSTLNRATAHWEKKNPEPGRGGNYGWFVESNIAGSKERWYVRKGRYWTIRRAMPRDLLEALKDQQGVAPDTIKLDFQLREHGLASWYARTYEGDLWSAWKSNRNPDSGIQTRRVLDDLESN